LTNNVTDACVDNNPHLEVLKTTVDGEVVSIDTVHEEDMGANVKRI